MLVKDIFGREINIGDEVILAAYDQCYKCKIIKETKKSIAYQVAEPNGEYIDDIRWTRKGINSYYGMYKIC